MPEDNLRGESEEDLCHITGTPRNGAATEKGEPKMVRAAQRWIYGLQVLKKLMRDKDTLLQHIHPNKIGIDRNCLGDTSKGGSESGLSMTKEGSDVMEDVT